MQKRNIILVVVVGIILVAITATLNLLKNSQDNRQNASTGDGTYTVSGKLFYDTNLNGVYDPGEKTLDSRVYGIDIRLNTGSGQGAQIETDQDGNYTYSFPSSGTHDYEVRVAGSLGGKSFFTTSSKTYKVPASKPASYTDLNFGFIYQTSHNGPKDTCMILATAPKYKYELTRDNNLNVMIFTNASKPQKVEVAIASSSSNGLPSGQNPFIPQTTLPMLGSDVMGVSPYSFSTGNPDTSSTGTITCTVKDVYTNQILDKKTLNLTVQYGHAIITDTSIEAQSPSDLYPLPSFDQIPVLTAASQGKADQVSISGTLFYDQNMNGVMDSGEPVLDGSKYGVVVLLIKNGSELKRQVPDASGKYTFTGLARGAGYYQIQKLAGQNGKQLLYPVTQDLQLDSYYFGDYKNADIGVIFNVPHSGPSDTCMIKAFPQTQQYPINVLQVKNNSVPIYAIANKKATNILEIETVADRLPSSLGNPWNIDLSKNGSAFVGGINLSQGYVLEGVSHASGTATVSCIVRDGTTKVILDKKTLSLTLRSGYGYDVTNITYPSNNNYTLASLEVINTGVTGQTVAITPSPSQGSSSCKLGDLNCDGNLDEIDFNILLREYAKAHKNN